MFLFNHQYTGAKPVFFILVIAILIPFSGCEKITDTDPDKLPAKLQFDFSMTSFSFSDNKDFATSETGSLATPSGSQTEPSGRPNQFVIDRGTMFIENIEFEGRRTQGQEHVYFMTDFPDAYEIDLSDPVVQPDITFDIPQGNYYFIEITLHLGTSELSSLIMNGTYEHPGHGVIPVHFDYGPREQVRIRARTSGGQTSIALSRERDSTAGIELDTDSLMRLINYGMIVNATVTETNGEEVLLIDETVNTGLFNSISARLPGAFTLVIE